MTQRYSRDLKILLELELQRNERVRAAVAAYRELAKRKRHCSVWQPALARTPES